MEEVWKNLAFSNHPYEHSPPHLSLQNQPTAGGSFTGHVLQNYLNGAVTEHQPAHWPQQLHVPAPFSKISGHYSFRSIAKKHSSAEWQPPAAIANSERRLKRMIKNRGSAAQSRARKQAYTKELELEIAQLAKENSALKREQQQLKMAMAGQVSCKGKLKRGSSALF